MELLNFKLCETVNLFLNYKTQEKNTKKLNKITKNENPKFPKFTIVGLVLVCFNFFSPKVTF